MKSQTLSVEKKLLFHKLSGKARVKPNIKINPNSIVKKYSMELIPKNTPIIHIHKLMNLRKSSHHAPIVNKNYLNLLPKSLTEIIKNQLKLHISHLLLI
jgi:hypothetical protein